MIRSGKIESGMIPKVEACLEMLDKGVRKIHIIDGRDRHSLLLGNLHDQGRRHRNRQRGLRLEATGSRLQDEDKDRRQTRRTQTRSTTKARAETVGSSDLKPVAWSLELPPWPSTDTLNSAEIIELFRRYVVPNYRRYNIVLARGEGSYVWDTDGRRYLDFFPGWGCNLLGHCPEPVVKAVQEQVATLIHVPNTWYTEAQGRWAQALVGAQFRRAGLLLQFGHRSQRSGDQAGPTAHAQRALQDHHLRRGLSRPHARRHRRHGPAQVSRRTRAL